MFKNNLNIPIVIVSTGKEQDAFSHDSTQRCDRWWPPPWLLDQRKLFRWNLTRWRWLLPYGKRLKAKMMTKSCMSERLRMGNVTFKKCRFDTRIAWPLPNYEFRYSNIIYCEFSWYFLWFALYSYWCYSTYCVFLLCGIGSLDTKYHM